jgi:hypothetical protein
MSIYELDKRGFSGILLLKGSGHYITGYLYLSRERSSQQETFYDTLIPVD